jgi:8-oxo-dGTP pyrophosphatase MutT (NUDIX family)
MSQEAIPAASLIVAREQSAGPLEYLMVERAGGMAFAAGALVFPGGRIDEADRQLGEARGVDPGVIAAIRETLEETAVPIGLSPTPDATLSATLQKSLAAGVSLSALLESFNLNLDGQALTPFARWVPKFHAVRRFDTWFYIAKCPPGEWMPRVIEGECAAAEWVTASEVLEREGKGQAKLIFPTRRNLERLACHDDFEALRADALAHAVVPITPWVEEHEGERYIRIPDDLGYPVTEARLDGLWRG